MSEYAPKCHKRTIKNVYRKKVLSGQETIHSRIGKKKQVKTAIDEIEEKLNEVSKKLDADEVDLRALQVSRRKPRTSRAVRHHLRPRGPDLS